MKILLTGASGQLGNELYPRLLKFGDVTAVDLDCSHSNAKDCRQLNLGDFSALEIMLNRVQPDLVVNAAAFTAVDLAEDEIELSFRINAEVPGRIARWAQRNECALLHYSTDYVFDGTSDTPYSESDTTSPQSIYGESKLAGELAIEASGCEHLIIRTSWVYSSHGSNFVLSMLALAERRLQLSVVDDQIGCPTWARNLAKASVHLIHSGLEPSTVGKGNIYHYCDADQTCWYDFAQMVFNTAVELELLETAPKLKPVSSGEYPQIATRPQFSVLDTGAIRESGFQPAGLSESLRTCMMDLKNE
jgi:dTDP-4-dehydrorhamnose reductase